MTVARRYGCTAYIMGVSVPEWVASGAYGCCAAVNTSPPGALVDGAAPSLSRMESSTGAVWT